MFSCHTTSFCPLSLYCTRDLCTSTEHWVWSICISTWVNYLLTRSHCLPVLLWYYNVFHSSKLCCYEIDFRWDLLIRNTRTSIKYLCLIYRSRWLRKQNRTSKLSQTISALVPEMNCTVQLKCSDAVLLNFGDHVQVCFEHQQTKPGDPLVWNQAICFLQKPRYPLSSRITSPA